MAPPCCARSPTASKARAAGSGDGAGQGHGIAAGEGYGLDERGQRRVGIGLLVAFDAAAEHRYEVVPNGVASRTGQVRAAGGEVAPDAAGCLRLARIAPHNQALQDQ